MNLADRIIAAFKSMQRSSVAADTSRPLITDRQDAERMGDRRREDLDWLLLREHADALYAMTPLALRYYLQWSIVLAMDKHDIDHCGYVMRLG
jgi:hypothetical protein